MSLIQFTADVQRDTMTADSYGGETAVSSTIYSGLTVTANYRTPVRAVNRFESAPGNTIGPGPLTDSRRIIFLDPWDGTQVIRVNDRFVPNPAKAELPTHFNVIGVRPYEGEAQYDVEDVSTTTAVI